MNGPNMLPHRLRDDRPAQTAPAALLAVLLWTGELLFALVLLPIVVTFVVLALGYNFLMSFAVPFVVMASVIAVIVWAMGAL